MKKRNRKQAMKKHTLQNTKLAGFVLPGHAGPVACTVTRSTKGTVLRCEFSDPDEDVAEDSNLSDDLEGVEAQDADEESRPAKAKVLADGALAGEQKDEPPADEQDEEDVELVASQSEVPRPAVALNWRCRGPSISSIPILWSRRA